MTRSADFVEIRGVAAEANRALALARLVAMSFGNVSHVDRGQGVMAIKPSGLACDSIMPDDVVVVALADGAIVWGDRRPSSDTVAIEETEHSSGGTSLVR